MGDDDGQCAEIAVDALDGFEDGNAGVHVERAGGFIAQQDIGAFRNGARDGDALLFATGKLGREVVHARTEADEFEGVLGRHGIATNFGDECDVFAGSQARNQIIRLKDKADGIAAKLGEARFIGCTQIPTTVEQGAVGGRIEAAELIQEGRFSAPRGSEQDDEFTAEEIEIDSA